jgi:AcrR family transcriptional regulator
MTARAEGAASTRDHIARAALELMMADDYDDVTLTGIAGTAGVSRQTVLNHFGSKEQVAAAAIEMISAETKGLRASAAPGDLRGAVRILMEQYEHSGDSNVRWAMASERLGSLAPRVSEARAYHQQWLAHVFEADLPTGRAARRRALHALHAATDVYTWKLLRRDLGLTRRETERTIADLVAGALGGTR